MNPLRQLLRLGADDRAVTALEYGIIGVLIAVVVAGGYTQIGNRLSAMVSATNTGW
jgi:Flp pilus assembly pilin Flp